MVTVAVADVDIRDDVNTIMGDVDVMRASNLHGTAFVHDDDGTKGRRTTNEGLSTTFSPHQTRATPMRRFKRGLHLGMGLKKRRGSANKKSSSITTVACNDDVVRGEGGRIGGMTTIDEILTHENNDWMISEEREFDKSGLIRKGRSAIQHTGGGETGTLKSPPGITAAKEDHYSNKIEGRSS